MTRDIEKEAEMKELKELLIHILENQIAIIRSQKYIIERDRPRFSETKITTRSKARDGLMKRKNRTEGIVKRIAIQAKQTKADK